MGAVAITSESDSTPKSGCTGLNPNINCSYHYSGKVFTDTKMIDGTGNAWLGNNVSPEAMPNPNGGTYTSGLGHSGNGVARITFVR